VSRALLLFILWPVLSWSLLAQAGWSPKAISYAERNFGTFPGPQRLNPDQRGAIATVWGGGMRAVRFTEDLRSDEQRIKLPGFFKKELRIHLRAQTKKAPLIVIVPGVFADSDDPLAHGAMRWFSKMGYHVLILPNCWSRDFAKARPVFKDEYPSGEANVVIETTKWAIKEIGARNVSDVSLMGESLGALTVSVAYARDSRSRNPIFTGGATMTWPPIKLYAAVTLLDEMMTSTDRLYRSKCHNLIRRLKTKWRILRGKYILDPTEDEIECAPAVVAQYSFRKELIKLAKTIDHVEHLHKDVPKDLTFRKFIRDYAPRYAAALKETDPYGSLHYWLRQTTSAAIRNVRIVTSEDDFLNDRESWNAPGFLDSPQDELIVAHWGGHIGLTDTKAYEGLMKAQFSLQ
jgi:predicted alpha/beta-fold hydrolase